MPERINCKYGQLKDGTRGIVEFSFDIDTWSYKKTGSTIEIRRKEA